MKLRHICGDEIIEVTIDDGVGLFKIYFTAGVNYTHGGDNSQLHKAISSSLELAYQRYQIEISAGALDEIALRIYELFYSGQTDTIAIPIKATVSLADIRTRK